MIKTKLKDINIKLVDFAKMLDISRPTLDNYIQLYESGQKLPKDKYDYIFKNLFSNDIQDKEELIEMLDKYHNLIERDKTLGTFDLSAKSTDLMNSILFNIREDMYTEEYNEKIYIFINMLITSYKKEKVFEDFVDYFLTLNSKIPLSMIEEDSEKKIFTSNCFKLMSNYKKKTLTFDTEYYNEFKNRIKSVKATIEKNTEKFREDIMRKVNAEIEARLKIGLDIDDIDIKEIVATLNSIKE